MANLPKVPFNINFQNGLDTKTDPFQIPPGKFLSFQNIVFNKGGLLQKRNGYGSLTNLPDDTSTAITTFNGNLTAIGNKIQAYIDGSQTWVDKGTLRPARLSTLPLVRSNTNQSQCDSAVSTNNLICTVFTDNVPSGGSNVAVYKYVVADSITGQNIVNPTPIPVTSGAITGSPRVFLLGKYFVIVFTNTIAGTAHLQYVAINTTIPTAITTNTDISAQYTPNSAVAFDGYVANDNLYLAWNGSDGGGAIRTRFLNSALALSSVHVTAGHSATTMSVTADTSGATPVIWVVFVDNGSGASFAMAFNQNLVQILAPTNITPAAAIFNVTAAATGGVCTAFFEVDNTYGYDGAILTDYIASKTITQSGTVGSTLIPIRSVGLASKAFAINSIVYFLCVYDSPTQPTFFLVDSNGNAIAKLAYSNGGGYLRFGLPNVNVSGTEVEIAYLIKDLLLPVNKAQGVTNFAGVYAQTGVNLVRINITSEGLTTAEIGQNLHITGGFMWMYDGYVAVEHGFHLWPDSVEATHTTTTGHLSSQIYFYQATYEWTDNQGNVHRSAPSVPLEVDLSGAGTSTNKVTINVPTLRVTYKTANPVKIVIYRWSTAQQTYFQVTSIQTPLLNDTTVDFVTWVDTLADASIAGNSIIYTTGGVVENIGAPAVSSITLFKSRLFAIASEDGNLWYSKQVIPSTPVEMSDLFTIYPAPTIGASGSTGLAKCIFPMDDKLIIYKKDAIYYITGTGPDNTGANNDFSEPVFITGTVGSSNQNSIVNMPQGLMSQSDKGIWLLGRDLSTLYIGSAVEQFNSNQVSSAIAIPATNQVRFTLDNKQTLMYDYYYGQWGTFINTPAISATLYQGLHTYISSLGQVFQESPNVYLDGSNPVLISFITGWINLAGLQGFQRAYFLHLLATYISPHTLTIQVGYDYNPNPSQSETIFPTNFNGTYGSDPLYGSSPSPTYGGNPAREQWRVFFEQGKCQAFQLYLQENYDATFGVTAGAGFTMSGLDLTLGMKKSYPTLNPSNSV